VATRLLERKTTLADGMQFLLGCPWIPTGELTANTLIKDTPGLLGGFTVEAINDLGNYEVEIWDSADGTTGAAYVKVARLTINGLTAGDMVSWKSPLEPGVECRFGIYLLIVAGTTPKIILYYK